MREPVLKYNVAEPPLFWAAPAPAPKAQGPGADFGSDPIGSAPASDTKICHFDSLSCKKVKL